VGPVGEAAAVFQPPAPRARRGERGGAAGPHWAGRLARGPQREGRGGKAGWAAREGEGAAGPRARGRGRLGRKGRRGGKREEKDFPFSLNLDEWFSQFQSNKTNALFGMVQQTKIKYL
jgi:hypothetical protein